MRIGFDISQTGNAKAGCGYFADNLIKNLVECDLDNEYLLYSAFGNTYFDPDRVRTTRRFSKSNCTHLLDNLNRQDSLAFWSDLNPVDETRLGNPQIVHANNFSCPKLTNAIIVYTLYDVSFLDVPNCSSEENRVVCFNGVFNAALYADYIIAISEYSRKRFLEVFPHFSPDKICVIYPGSRFDGKLGSETPVANLTTDKFWLCVGTLEPRKNLRTLLHAYRQYIDTNDDSKPLVLVGGRGWLEDDLDLFIDNLGLSESVVKLGYVDDSTLRWLYKNCWAFVYPSIYEGFGLPVLEAMSLGAAVITSNTTSLPEVGRDAVLYVNPTNQNEIAEGFAMLNSDELRSKLKVLGQKQSQKFSWEQTASQVLAVYKKLLDINHPK
jgi:glycosyltransferase involved in cell wall biosynthesis